jgi:PAS domain S-box-containing protein
MDDKRYELILDITTEGFWDWDLKTDRAYLSPRYRELIGCQADETVFDSAFFSSLLHPDDREQVFRTIGACLAGSLDVSIVEYRMIQKDGSLRWIEGRGKIVERDEQGLPSRMMGTVVDISERKAAEEAISRSEHFMRAMIDAISANICVLDQQGTILFVNKGWQDFAISNPPVPQNSGVGLNYLAVCDAAGGDDREDARRFAEGIRSVLRRDTACYTQEYPCHSDLEERWFKGKVTLFEQGGQVRVVIAHENISRKKRFEFALLKSEERYRAVVEDQTEVIVRYQPDGTITFVNEVYCRFFGGSQAELIGRRWQPTVLPEDVSLVESELGRMSASSPVVVVENRVRSAQGDTRWMQFVNRGFYNDRGELVETQAVGREITARKMAEQALRESNQRFATVFHASPVAITLSRMDSDQFIDVNDSFLKLCGYERAEVIGRTSYELGLWPHREDHAKLMNDVREHGRVQQFETTFRDKSGLIGHLLLSGEFIELSGEQYMIGMLSDITERKQTEEQGRQALEQQVRARTADLSYAVQRLLREIDDRKKMEQEILDHQRKFESLTMELAIAEERERDRIAGELHDQVGQRLILAKMKLDSLASRLSSEKLETDTEEINGLIGQTIQDIRSLTFQIRPPLLASAGLEAAVQWLGEELKRDYGLRMEFVDDKKVKQLKYESRSTVYQAVRELLLNVAKHAGTAHVQTRIAREDDLLAIYIEDGGRGFDTSEARSSISSRGGFGLFNIQQRIQYLGGYVTIDSEPGKGTRATIKVLLEKTGDQGRAVDHVENTAC